jgi:hypothetical protein
VRYLSRYLSKSNASYSLGKAQQLVKQTFIRTNSPKKCTYKTDERIGIRRRIQVFAWLPK